MSKQQTKQPQQSAEKTTKDFDCIEMKRAAGERIYQEIKDLTPEEEAAYWARVAVEMRKAFEERSGEKVS